MGDSEGTTGRRPEVVPCQAAEAVKEEETTTCIKGDEAERFSVSNPAMRYGADDGNRSGQRRGSRVFFTVLIWFILAGRRERARVLPP